MTDSNEEELLRVLKHQGENSTAEVGKAEQAAQAADEAIAKTKALLHNHGVAPAAESPSRTVTQSASPSDLRSFAEIHADAVASHPGPISFADVLSPVEEAAARAELRCWTAEFSDIHELDRYDYMVGGAAGILAGLADVFLVALPKHPGYFGSEPSEGGWLSRAVKERFGEILPKEKIDKLEHAFQVPYDAVRNSDLNQPVPGLGPRTHRLHALGHDPVLGWIVGVRDVLTGQFSAIGSDGSVVVQPIGKWSDAAIHDVFVPRIIEALRIVGGHLLSDIATPAGLPPPFFALLQFLQRGEIGGHSVAEISRGMYRAGYDFRHFVAGGLCVAIVEIVVRLAWMIRRIYEGSSLYDALPIGNATRLTTTLFLAHSVAAAVNAGKVYVTQNPLAVNWAQWLALLRYLLPQLHWVLVGKEAARHDFIQAKLDARWAAIDEQFETQFRESGLVPIRL